MYISCLGTSIVVVSNFDCAMKTTAKTQLKTNECVYLMKGNFLLNKLDVFKYNNLKTENEIYY